MVWRIRFIVILLAVIIATAAATKAYTAPAAPQTRVETDQKTGAIRFIVNGQEAARLDSVGLHVRRHIEYGGSIMDATVAGYELRKSATK